MSREVLDWPIFVLTLAGDDTRRAPLEKSLQRLHLPYELVFGVDGRDGLPPKYEDQIDRELTVQRLGHGLSDGEYACALSHKEIYQRIIDNNLPGAIILEDDAKILPEFRGFVLEKDYLRAPMILLDYAYGRATRISSIKVSQGTLRRAATQSTASTGYSLNSITARALLRETTPIKAIADWPASLYDLQAWMMVPRLVRHNPPGVGPSDLDSQRRQLGFGLLRVTGPRAWLRRRLSVRVGRARGER